MDPDLAETLARARRGDAQALDRLLDSEQRFLALQVSRHVDAALRSRIENDDVLQEARLRIVRSVEDAEFCSLPAFRAWLATIVRNVVIDLRRKYFGAQKRGESPLSLEEGIATSPSGVTTSLRDRLRAAGPGPSSIVRRREDISLLETALSRLKQHHREILRLVHFERLRLTDIAARTGRKPATVRKELARALLACRAVLDELHAGAKNEKKADRTSRGGETK